MARMTDVDVDFISLVKKGANKQKIQIYKADDYEPETTNDKSIEEVTGFFNVLKSFFAGENVKKEEKSTIKGFKERMTTRALMDNIWRVNDTLVSTMRDILGNPDVKDKEVLIATAIDEHGEYLKAKTKGVDDVKKSFDFFKKEEEEDMKKEDLQEIVKGAIEPLNAKIVALEKELNPGEENKDDSKEGIITKEDITKTVKQAMEPLSERIEKIEDQKGISRQLENEEREVEKSTSVFAGINI